MITRAHVMPYMNQHVVVRTNDGRIHHGILHAVNDDGIFLRPMRGNMAMTSASVEMDLPTTLDNLPQDGDLTEAWFPFLFFPWFWLGGFWPGWWW